MTTFLIVLGGIVFVALVFFWYFWPLTGIPYWLDEMCDLRKKE